MTTHLASTSTTGAIYVCPTSNMIYLNMLKIQVKNSKDAAFELDPGMGQLILMGQRGERMPRVRQRALLKHGFMNTGGTHTLQRVRRSCWPLSPK